MTHSTAVNRDSKYAYDARPSTKHPQSEEVNHSYIQTAKRATPLICLIYQQIGILARDTIKRR